MILQISADAQEFMLSESLWKADVGHSLLPPLFWNNVPGQDIPEHLAVALGIRLHVLFSHGSVCFDLRNLQKKCDTNHIPLATAYWTSLLSSHLRIRKQRLAKTSKTGLNLP